jgi:prepilin-type N-terminal cleavage/methylation domain-containing protein
MKIRRQNYFTNKYQKGYTLIELLLYVAILGTLLTVAVVFFGIVTDARVKNQSIIEVNDQGAAVMDYITQTIRNASSITSPAIGASGTSLTLVVPTGALSPTVFSLNGVAPITIQVKEGAGAQVLLTSNDVQISGLTFKNLSRASTPGVVQVSFTISRVNANSKNEFDYQKTFIDSAEVTW